MEIKMGLKFLGFSCSESSSLGLAIKKKKTTAYIQQQLINTSASDMAILAPEKLPFA